MKVITVDPEILEACARRMEEENQDYERSYMQLFEAVDTMRSGWQGKDNTSFSNQIYKFRSDFKEMSVLCAQYAEFLRNSARAYREMQEELAAQAARLAQ